MLSYLSTLLPSLKDDDSGDHDQEHGSPKDCEKERHEEEERDQNPAKKKVCVRVGFMYLLNECVCVE